MVQEELQFRNMQEGMAVCRNRENLLAMQAAVTRVSFIVIFQTITALTFLHILLLNKVPG
jgi:hypothetical protein